MSFFNQLLPEPLVLAGAAFVLSAALCLLIIRLFQRRLDRSTLHQDLNAVQAMHSRPTPRIGGAAIIGVFALLFASQAPRMADDLIYAVLAGAVVFAAGLREDILRNVSARKRFFAALISAALTMALTADLITRTNIVQLDWIFSAYAISIVVTLIWSAGTCHSLNLIDGLNGLSSSYSIVALFALGMLAGTIGAADVQTVCYILMGALLGFLVFNWPHGRLFLGDGGAYAIGHMLAWIGIILVNREPNISPLALLLILFWPVADTVFSMVRRIILGKSIAAPDRLHFHHIVGRMLMQLAKGRVHADWVNPATTLVLLPLFSAPALASIVLWNKPVTALVALLLFAILYLICYIIIADLLSNRRIARKKR
jgi:UDP-GlcNAc:undecaprenyl-phosphate/decaprenyl-phosphate GlcNAc-1-phosphate transferase